MVGLAPRTACSTLLLLAACQTHLAENSSCNLDGSSVPLPGELRETSGIAVSIRNPNLVWTHNDGGRPFLYAVDRLGEIRARVELNRRNDDWEDVARGRCELGACLYVAGTGDNDARREVISLYRLAEPEGEGEQSVAAEQYQMVLPDGPRDIEALYVLPTDQVFFVTKGRNHPVTVYRYPPPLRSDEVVTLIEVQRLTDGPRSRRRMVTGASATLDGSTVAIRTYDTLEFFEVTEGGRLVESGTGGVDLRALREVQGEGVGFGADGAIVLSSEAAMGFAPSLSFLTCELG